MLMKARVLHFISKEMVCSFYHKLHYNVHDMLFGSFDTSVGKVHLSGYLMLDDQDEESEDEDGESFDEGDHAGQYLSSGDDEEEESETESDAGFMIIDCLFLSLVIIYFWA